MKKIIFLMPFLLLVINGVRAQDIIKGQKNQVSLVKGSRAMPEVKFKLGISVILQNGDDGMNFTAVKNGKQYPLFKPVNATYGQVAEIDVENDGVPEIAAGYRTGPNDFIVTIYKKAQFETEYKQWAVVNGQSYCEFPGNGTVKIYAKDGASKTLKFGDDGMLNEIK